MCGIFAYAGETPPSTTRLLAAAKAAGYRGPHGHGWVSDDVTHRSLGPLDPSQVPTPERWIVGHSRLATFGMPRDETGLQPVTVDGHVLAHNGNVYNWRELAGDFGLDDAPTDSWLLGRMYALQRESGQDPQDALSSILAVCQMKAGAIVVRDASGALLTFRERLPLQAITTTGGVYLSSGRFNHSYPLPTGRVVTVKDSTP